MHVVTQVITWSKLEIISVLRLKRPWTPEQFIIWQAASKSRNNCALARK